MKSLSQILFVKVLFLFFIIYISGCAGINEEKINEEKHAEEMYRNEIISVVRAMKTSAAEAEEIMAAYSKVWSYSIQNSMHGGDFLNLLNLRTNLGSRDVKILKEVWGQEGSERIKKGDFSRAIYYTRAYYDKLDKISSLESDKLNISRTVQSLNDPPTRYKEVFDLIIEVNILYEEYVSLALSPSGSLANFNQNANSLSSQFISKVREFDIRIN